MHIQTHKRNMSKRFIFSEHNNSRKRAKLDVSISDHNFPLSQNNDNNKESDPAWGDDNDDEMLLLASQVCEQAYSQDDISILPDYTLCMQPASTSTQASEPSTSKAEFTFKKPSVNSPRIVSTSMRQKCTTISSPLPGISTKAMKQTNDMNLSDDLILSDKIFKGHDSDYVYRQLLQLQEENAKLKSENGKLLEKCVTKEGEASILRTQLKSCQVAVDNARLDKIKAQEKVQMEWTEKLTAANCQMGDLRTQLDFKNLEIISIKEKCKKLESTKVKLTQVTVGGSDMTNSHRNSFTNDSVTSQSRRVKMSTSSVQTESMAHFLELHTGYTADNSKGPSLLPHILEPSSDKPSLLSFNEKLQKRTDSLQKCRVFSTFHRVACSPTPVRGSKVTLSILTEDLVAVSTGKVDVEVYFKIFNAVHTSLLEVREQLLMISQRMTTAFQKEMDERYIDSSLTHLDISLEDLLKGRALYKEEQAIVCRRLVAVLAGISATKTGSSVFHEYLSRNNTTFLDTIAGICTLLDTTWCALVYSGLLLSITYLIMTLPDPYRPNIQAIVKTIISSRPMSFVMTHVIRLLRNMSLWKDFAGLMCPRSTSGNLRLDYDQGVLLYKKESCLLQVVVKQVEACLKCMDTGHLYGPAVDTTRHLILLYNNLATYTTDDRPRCECQLVLLQVLVYALRICAALLTARYGDKQELLSLCRCGVAIVHRSVLGERSVGASLPHDDGHLIHFCQLITTLTHHDIYANMLSELSASLQSSPEEMPPSFHSQPWLNSFQTFSIQD